MTVTTTHIGLTTPGERQIIVQPRDGRAPARYPALYTHGAGSGADIYQNYGHQTVTVNNLARDGVLGFSGDFGGAQTWGNAAAMGAMTAAYNWLQPQRGVKTGKVVIHGGSMGGLNALVWAAANRDKVAAVSLEIPVLDLTGIHAGNISGFAAIIDAAYGGAYVAGTMGPSKDPLTLAAAGAFNELPILVNYGDSDAICLPAKAEQFLSLVPSAVGFELSGGHAESTQLQVDRQYQTEFLLSHA
jgi:acetyl esterase/lipase